MVKAKHKSAAVSKLIEENQKKANYVFLGIGVTLFVMNVTAFISFVKDMTYDFMFFNTAIFSSIIIVLISVYYITKVHK